jgi:DNA invertase Pin-like site-specific DNA recombinase
MQSRQHQQGRSLRKLTDEQEKEIVYLYEDMSILALAFMWNISRSTVTRGS